MKEEILNDIKYNKDCSNPIEYYELQLYRGWIIDRILINYKQYTYESIKDKSIVELETIHDEKKILIKVEKE